ncbi:AbiTii domain-containing protein [Bordetella bronchiseptica]
MSLLHEIQASVLQDGSELGPILLRLRLLAARIGSQPLAEWVRHESEGYPRDAELPNYRYIPVSYTASFSGPFGSGISNAPISPYLIRKFAGEHWVRHEMRESVAAVDALLATAESGGSLGVNAADLILLLQGKVYADYACNSVTGSIARSSLASIRHAVRSRVLELTLELEKSVPDAAAITLGPSSLPSAPSSAAATQIAQQIIYGNFTSIAATGEGATIQVAVVPHDAKSLEQFLEGSGMAVEDAQELARLAASEKPDSSAEPMGPKVQKWFVENLQKAASGTWKMGVAVATDVVKEALLKYYGLK